MKLAGLLFLLSLTGGSASNHSVQPDLLVLQPKSNYSFKESGSPSNYSEPGVLLNETLRSNSSFEESGSGSVEQDDVDAPMSDSSPDINWKRKCSFRDVYGTLTNTPRNMILPADNESPTKVELDVIPYAILDVNEKDQKFISCLWIDVLWTDKSLSWEPGEFCGIKHIHLPTKEVWTPDLTIEEMTEKDKAQPTPYLLVKSNGDVMFRNIMVVTSTCKMEVYKFPFDVQSCNLSFKSVIYIEKYVKLKELNDARWTQNWTTKLMQTGSEWLFVDIKISSESVNNFGLQQSKLVYTISMRRRPVLYIANFLLPVLFFFCLDLASFLISENSGEKLSFKVTVLLAVTVMQLILNEILPTTSDRVPLVAVYCIGMFGLMMSSLFETILVMYLMGKDIEADEPKSEDCEDRQNKVSFCSCTKELKKWTPCACVCDVSADEPPSEMLSATKEVNSSELTEESIALEKLSGELKEVIQLFNSREEAGKFSYWTRVAKKINKIFLISYVTVAIVFLVVMFSLWNY